MAPEVQVDLEKGADWPGYILKLPIFIKETVAATRTVKYILSKTTGPLELHLGVDNTAAGAALTHRYSGCFFVLPFLAKMSKALHERKSTLQIHRLKSKENSSDPASRHRQCSDEDAMRCLAIMKQQMKGIIDTSREADSSAEPHGEGVQAREEDIRGMRDGTYDEDPEDPENPDNLDETLLMALLDLPDGVTEIDEAAVPPGMEEWQ